MRQYATLRAMPASSKHRNPKHKLNHRTVLTPRETVAATRKGFKRPSPELAELLRLANLVPSNEELPQLRYAWGAVLVGEARMSPTAYNLRKMIGSLPDAIRLDIIENAGLITEPTSDPYSREFQNCLAAYRRYQTIVDARENLQRLIDRSPGPLHLQVEATRENGRLKLQPAEDDWAVKALLSAELDYLSRCAYDKCGRFFYAVRRGQPGCKPEHSDIIRKQRKRKRDKANNELKKTRMKNRPRQRVNVATAVHR